MPRGKPLDENAISLIHNFMDKNNCNMTKVADIAGIPRSTFGDMMRGNNVSRRNRKKIEEFFKKGESYENSIPMPEIKGNEEPSISKEDIYIIFAQFKIGADLLVPALKALANSDVGTRSLLHKKFGREWQELYSLIRALASESMREIVKRETGKATF